MEEKLTGPARVRALISGRVQMVGFRAWAEQRARSYGLGGRVRNLPTGEVEVIAEGDRGLLEKFVSELRGGPRGARVESLLLSWEHARGQFSDFDIGY